MADRESVALTGVLAALCACLVGCGDDVSNATANASASKAVERVEAYSSKEDPLAAPTLHIDGMSSIRLWGEWKRVSITGERSLEFDYPEDLVEILPSEGSGWLKPNQPAIIKPGEEKSILWRARTDPSNTKRVDVIESYFPGVYAKNMDVEGINGGGLVATASETKRPKPFVGDVLFWQEHRSQTNQLVGFDLAFKCYDQELLNSLPGHMPSGTIRWTPFRCEEYDCGYRRSSFGNTTRYSSITEEPSTGIVKPGERPECTIQISEHDESAVVRLSMRCWPDSMPYELMFVEFSPNPSLKVGEQIVKEDIHVYLPKSPFKAEGFELPEFQEAAKSE
jgi:hypothetical protein